MTVVSLNGRSRVDKLQARMQAGFPEITNGGKIEKTCANVRHALKLMGITCHTISSTISF